jgi:TPR repeat protein
MVTVYKKGHICKADDKMAVSYYKKAAKNGNASAMYIPGHMS